MWGKLAAVAAPVLVAAVLASPAHADDATYLDQMRNSPGVLGGPINEAIYVNQGHRACDILHGGATLDDAVAQLTVPIYVQPWLARTMVTAAQQQLCPAAA